MDELRERAEIAHLAAEIAAQHKETELTHAYAALSAAKSGALRRLDSRWERSLLTLAWQAWYITHARHRLAQGAPRPVPMAPRATRAHAVEESLSDEAAAASAAAAVTASAISALAASRIGEVDGGGGGARRSFSAGSKGSRSISFSLKGDEVAPAAWGSWSSADDAGADPARRRSCSGGASSLASTMLSGVTGWRRRRSTDAMGGASSGAVGADATPSESACTPSTGRARSTSGGASDPDEAEGADAISSASESSGGDRRDRRQRVGPARPPRRLATSLLPFQRGGGGAGAGKSSSEEEPPSARRGGSRLAQQPRPRVGAAAAVATSGASEGGDAVGMDRAMPEEQQQQRAYQAALAQYQAELKEYEERLLPAYLAAEERKQAPPQSASQSRPRPAAAAPTADAAQAAGAARDEARGRDANDAYDEYEYEYAYTYDGGDEAEPRARASAVAEDPWEVMGELDAALEDM